MIVNKLKHGDLREWRKLLWNFLTKINEFVTNRLNSKMFLINTDQNIVRNATNGSTNINSYQWQQILKEICLLNDIPMIDMFKLSNC